MSCRPARGREARAPAPHCRSSGAGCRRSSARWTFVSPEFSRPQQRNAGPKARHLYLNRRVPRNLLSGELPDHRLKTRELLLDEVDADLVGEFHLVVELGVRGADEDFRRIEGEGI